MIKLLILLVCIVLMSSCSAGDGAENAVEHSINDWPDSNTLSNDGTMSDIEADINISEKLFIAQTNDIYLNTEDYLGKTIKYEGIFKSMYWEQTDKTYNFVIRYGPGCCGYDGEAGFQITWNGDLPQDNDWCEAVGVLETYEEDDTTLLRLALKSLVVLETRGEEFVFQ